jgi:tryptophan synthase alpha chain
MGYYNTALQYGMEPFLSRCQECGISGVILPDLPPEMYEKMYRPAFESAGIHFICLIAPQTSPERAKYLASVSRGFLYLLSSSSTTGSLVEGGQTFSKLPDLTRITHLPKLVGFGIHDRESFRSACGRAQGAIIGTAFIRYLEEHLKGARSEGREDRIRLICRNFIEKITG